jgi:hypothetical protein
MLDNIQSTFDSSSSDLSFECDVLLKSQVIPKYGELRRSHEAIIPFQLVVKLDEFRIMTC